MGVGGQSHEKKWLGKKFEVVWARQENSNNISTRHQCLIIYACPIFQNKKRQDPPLGPAFVFILGKNLRKWVFLTS